MDIHKQGTYPIEDTRTLTALERWQEVALGWRNYVEAGQVRCADCKQSMYAILDSFGKPYQLTDADLTAFTVAHLRQRHEDIGKDFI